MDRERLQSRLSDIEQALKEARAADVRDLLGDLLDSCRQDLEALNDPVRADTARAAQPKPSAAGS